MDHLLDKVLQLCKAHIPNLKLVCLIQDKYQGMALLRPKIKACKHRKDGKLSVSLAELGMSNGNLAVVTTVDSAPASTGSGGSPWNRQRKGKWHWGEESRSADSWRLQTALENRTARRWCYRRGAAAEERPRWSAQELSSAVTTRPRASVLSLQPKPSDATQTTTFK